MTAAAIRPPCREEVARAGFAVGSGGSAAHRWAFAWLPSDPNERVVRLGLPPLAPVSPRTVRVPTDGILRWAADVSVRHGPSFWEQDAPRAVHGVHGGRPPRLVELPDEAGPLVVALSRGAPWPVAAAGATSALGADGLPVLATLAAHGLLSDAATVEPPGGWTQRSLLRNPFATTWRDADGLYLYCPASDVTLRVPEAVNGLLSCCTVPAPPSCVELCELGPADRRSELVAVVQRLVECAFLLAVEPPYVGPDHNGGSHAAQ